MELKHKLKNKIPTLGTWVTIYHRSVVEIACDSNLDWICLDLEHSSMTMDQVATLISVARGRGTPALVRLSSNDSVQIKRVMDAGASGIVVPMVKTNEDAEFAYKSMCYPPQGIRGVGLSSAQDYGASFERYKRWQENSPILIVQIEHIEAVKNFKDIMSVPAVDGFIVGPYDLSASLGIPGDFENPIFKDVKKKLDDLVSQTNKASGVHIVEPDPILLKENLKKGYSFLAISFETRILDVFYKNCHHLFEGSRSEDLSLDSIS